MELIQQFMDWAEANLAWTMAAAFVFALVESLAVVGLFIPGIVLLFAVGALVGWDPVALVMVWLAASAGAALGDTLSYWLGRYFREDLAVIWPFSRHPEWLSNGRVLIDRHGGKSIFIGRFIGPLRPIVPLVAGMLQMPPRPFALFMLAGCLLWAPLYLLPGVVFGASLELAMEFGGRLAVLLVLLVLGIWLILWLTRLIYDFSARRGAWWLKALVQWSRRHPLMGRVVEPLFEPGKRREVLSVALLGMILTLSMAGLLAALVLAPLATPAWDAELQVATLAASLRNHYADPLFVALSLAGEVEVIAVLAALIALVLLALNRRNAAWHWLLATAGAWLAAELINGFMGVLLRRPDVSAAVGEVPHTAFTLTTAVFGFFAVMLAKDLRPRRRKWPYLATVLALTLIGFAHFYLGRATLTGLIAALATGGIWLALAGIGYRSRAAARPWPLLPVLAFYGGFVLVAGHHVGAEYRPTLQTSRLAQPARVLDGAEWLRTEWERLPQHRSRVGRAAVQRFDAQLSGDLAGLKTRLDESGWEPFPVIDLDSLMALFSADVRQRDLPHLSRDFAGRPENLGRRHTLPDGRVAVLRAWSSGARLQPGGVPVWLVQVRLVEHKTVIGGINRWKEVADGRDQAMESLRVAGWDWHWTQPQPDGPWLAVIPPNVANPVLFSETANERK